MTLVKTNSIIRSLTAMLCAFSQIAMASEPVKTSGTKRSFISVDPISNQLNFYDLVKTENTPGSKAIFLTSQTSAIIGEQDDPSILASIYLNRLKTELDIAPDNGTFQITSLTKTSHGSKHVSFCQEVNGIKVFGKELKVHFDQEGKLRAINGLATNLTSQAKTATINESLAIEITKKELTKVTKVYALNSFQKRLMAYKGPSADLFYVTHKNKLELCWKVEFCPSLHETWQVFVSAISGQVLSKKELSCNIDGPKRSKNSVDLDNKEVEIGTYKSGDSYYLVDASKPMFDAENSVIPEGGIGVIRTFDANGLTRDEIENAKIPSALENSFGKNIKEKAAVSAQNNASTYYNRLAQAPFNFNSFDNKGTNITIYVNMYDPLNPFVGWDNASYRGGGVVFLGKGSNQYNSPLSKGLDVVAHELTHGLIQNATNIEKSSRNTIENAALIEAICDIMAIIVDGNFTIGENSNINKKYRLSGLIRNPEAPHNGFSSSGNWGTNESNGYTANHYDELVNSEKAAHYNSTIISHAFYLMTKGSNNDGMEMSVVSELFFEVLTNYLTAGSNFNDFKNAMFLAVDIRYGVGSDYYNIIKQAFNEVGLITENKEINPDDLPSIIGENYVISKVSANGFDDVMSLYKMAENSEDERFSDDFDFRSNASVTDNGKYIYTIDQNFEVVRINYGQKLGIHKMSDSISPGFKEVSVSKGNKRLALANSMLDTSIHIYNMSNGEIRQFNLNIKATVNHKEKFYDLIPLEVGSMEWDYHGTKIIFDYKSKFIDDLGQTHLVWNIGEMNVWDTASNNFSKGEIYVYYDQLSSGLDFRYPSFAKNTTNLFVHDVFDKKRDQNTVVAWSITENGANRTDVLKTKTLAHASYTNTDSGLVVTDLDENGEPALYLIQLKGDKVSVKSGVEPYKLIPERRNPKWFTLGVRTSLPPAPKIQNIGLYPNPASHQITLNGIEDYNRFSIFNSLGQVVLNGKNSNGSIVPIESLESGTYLIRLEAEHSIYTSTFIKE
ncbi:MAG: M4 family metallopeptidase [Bacteroidia bacterium]